MKKKKLIKLTLFTFFILSLTFAFGSFLTTKAIEFGGIGGRPANPRADNPRTESIFVYTLDAGKSLEDAVKVINNTEEQKTLLVYSVDSVSSSDGAFACAPKVEPKNDVGNWIKLEKSEVTLDSLKSEVVSFEFEIPANAGVGEYNGCIIIEEKNAAPQVDGVNGIAITTRTGLRVSASVPGDITKKLVLKSFTTTKSEDGKKLVFKVEIENQGNVSIDAEIKIKSKYVDLLKGDLPDPGGKFAILRGETTVLTFELDKPYWGGFVQSTLDIAYDKANFEIGKENPNPEIVNLESASVWNFVIPSVGAVAIELAMLLLVVAVFVALLITIRHKRYIDKNWVEYKVDKEESVQKLADRFGASWKELSKANKIKAPYMLEKGQLIKVPSVIKMGKIEKN